MNLNKSLLNPQMSPRVVNLTSNQQGVVELTHRDKVEYYGSSVLRIQLLKYILEEERE